MSLIGEEFKPFLNESYNKGDSFRIIFLIELSLIYVFKNIWGFLPLILKGFYPIKAIKLLYCPPKNPLKGG